LPSAEKSPLSESETPILIGELFFDAEPDGDPDEELEHAANARAAAPRTATAR
jgi:hypothetical protein